MKYRVYYSENAYTAQTIDANNPKEAAAKYYSLFPRNYSGNITVEEKGIGKNEYNKYPISEFNPSVSSEPKSNTSLSLPKVEKKYHTTSGVANYLTFIGWFNIVIAISLLLIGLLSLDKEGLALIGIAVVSFVAGIFILLLAELLQSIISIEENTRTTNELLQKFINQSQ